MTTKAPTSRRLTRYLAVPAFAMGLAIGSAAAANAEREWDIGAYDDCMKKTIRDAAWCCLTSGGVVTDANAQDGSGCAAPPAEQSGRNPLPSDAPTHVIQPLPLPGQGGGLGPAPGGVLTSSP